MICRPSSRIKFLKGRRIKDSPEIENRDVSPIFHKLNQQILKMADKWFEDKLDTRKLRSYTRSQLKPSPIQNMQKISRQYSVTTWLIIISVAMFIFSFLAMAFFNSDEVFKYLAIQPNLFFNGYFWTLITSMFMHANFTHLFVNMVSLFFIGNFIEKLIGRKRYFWLYMFSGIIAGLFFVFFAFYFGSTNPDSLAYRLVGSPEIFAVGASGAIFALGGLLAVLTPRLRVYVFFILPMQMWIAMIVLLLVLWAASVGAGLPFGNTAHLGGLLVGVFYALYLKKRYRRKTAMIQKYFSG